MAASSSSCARPDPQERGLLRFPSLPSNRRWAIAACVAAGAISLHRQSAGYCATVRRHCSCYDADRAAGISVGGIRGWGRRRKASSQDRANIEIVSGLALDNAPEDERVLSHGHRLSDRECKLCVGRKRRAMWASQHGKSEERDEKQGASDAAHGYRLFLGHSWWAMHPVRSQLLQRLAPPATVRRVYASNSFTPRDAGRARCNTANCSAPPQPVVPWRPQASIYDARPEVSIGEMRITSVDLHRGGVVRVSPRAQTADVFHRNDRRRWEGGRRGPLRFKTALPSP